ncbi:hypothetical protein, conserved [Eimeria acervulina]|uniref:Uncharacterized protein n=1 Tax=Eimeria acervulina TaxID=5801 RepID=U6GGS3_EIMAC|nr:hypothetical protein, conserved [Eimeria acervulina]CDI78752.1 hypothetical protein, conserved [Eimeria acervulina]
MCRRSKHLRTETVSFTFKGIDVTVTVTELLTLEAGVQLEQALLSIVEEIQSRAPGKPDTVGGAADSVSLARASILQPLTVAMGQLRIAGDAPSGASGPSTLEQGTDLSGSGGPQVAQLGVGSNGGN